MNTTWKILHCDRFTSNSFIKTAYWICDSVDGDYFASINGSCNFPIATPIIPYADVTEQDVLDWCWENGVNKKSVETSLTAQIEVQKNPVTLTGVPWQ